MNKYIKLIVWSVIVLIVATFIYKKGKEGYEKLEDYKENSIFLNPNKR